MLLNTLLNPDTPRPLGASTVAAVIFDWAGTTVDFGSLSPVRTLQLAFGNAGVAITEEEARRDMGIAKRDHIASLLGIARVRSEWSRVHNRPATDSDVDAIYQCFIPLQMECLLQYSQVIRGVPELTRDLRAQGIKIGSTTGYTREMLNLLLAHAVRQGYQPDCALVPQDAGAGRPAPFMIYRAAVELQVYPFSRIVKVGDTISDVQEGLNAGVWSVGVAATGNGIGLSDAAFQSLSRSAQEQLIQKSGEDLRRAGAHYVIATLADLPAVISDIEAVLQGRIAS